MLKTIQSYSIIPSKRQVLDEMYRPNIQLKELISCMILFFNRKVRIYSKI